MRSGANPKRSETGSVIPFLALTVLAILLIAGSLAYASARTRAYLRARDHATAAAEAAAQRLDQQALHGGVLEIDRRAAEDAVQAYLADVGSKGRIVEIGTTTAASTCGEDSRAGPTRWRSCVRVEVEEHFNPGNGTVKATGTARPIAGVREADA